jgi:hypothetical protein
MAKPKHTPGPWRADGPNVTAPSARIERIVATCAGLGGHYNATRIVECINGCEGIENPSALSAVLEAVKEVQKVYGDDSNGVHQKLYAAVSKALGR